MIGSLGICEHLPFQLRHLVNGGSYDAMPDKPLVPVIALIEPSATQEGKGESQRIEKLSLDFLA